MIVVVMGVAGSGKTTVGQLLARQLGWRFADADDFHSATNVDKIRHGIPLTDADRAPWLHSIRDAIQEWMSAGQNVVLACSALKRAYRDELQVGPKVQFVYLKGTAQLIRDRLSSRQGHFANADILESQLATLEEPDDSLTVDISGSPEEIVAEIRAKLGLRYRS